GGLVSTEYVQLGTDPGTPLGSSGELIVQGTPAARGVLETASLMKNNGAASVLFDGGILRATASSDDGSPFIGSVADPLEVKVSANGMLIDSQSFDVSADNSFADDNAAAPGFIEKHGSG